MGERPEELAFGQVWKFTRGRLGVVHAVMLKQDRDLLWMGAVVTPGGNVLKEIEGEHSYRHLWFSHKTYEEPDMDFVRVDIALAMKLTDLFQDHYHGAIRRLLKGN